VIKTDSIPSVLVAIVVINWNNSQDTLTCIESLQRLNYNNYHVLLLDNGSDDDSLVVLSEATKGLTDFTLLETGENLGFSGGVNFGIVEAEKLQAEYIWLLNNDTEVASDCLDRLIQAMNANPDVAIAGSKIFLADRKDVIWHAGATFSKYTGQPQHLGLGANDNDLDYAVDKLVDYVTGCSLVLRQNLIAKIGVMDDRFYLYYEEADLCYRARELGFKILYVSESKLWHKVAGSSTGLYVRIYYEVRNRLLFTIKNKPSHFVFALIFLLFKNFVTPLFAFEFKIVKSALLGFIDFFTSKFGKLNHNL
jgi:GT2 family glycosyltransferase